MNPIASMATAAQILVNADRPERPGHMQAGADDYVCKPFSPRKVVAMVKALLHRTHGAGYRHALLTD